MKKYLSSYKLWDNPERLFELFWENKKIAYISNALDSIPLDRKKLRDEWEMQDLRDLGFQVEQIDLKEYFWRQEELEKKMKTFWWVYVTGGNVFILQQAYRLSWLDEIITNYEKSNSKFVYSWYSAGICILAPSLKWLDIVDDPNVYPYDDIKTTIWEGLWILDYSISPHYDSDHPESGDIDKEIQYCIENKILFKALRDGEVLIYN